MTRIFTDGAESGDLLFWDNPGGMAVVSNVKRSGNYSYESNASSVCEKSITALSEGYLRTALRLNNSGVAGTFVEWKKGATVLGSARVNATNLLELYVGTTLVATGTTALTNLTWYSIEIHTKIDDTTGALDLELDGTLEVQFAGDTKPGADTTFDLFNFNDVGSNEFWFDDIAFNDTSGAVDNSWCGDGRVVLLMPSGNGDSSQLVGSDANSTDNYLLVDELPANGDTDYVEGSTTDNKDLYAITDSTAFDMQDIKRVWVEARAIDTVANGGNIALVLKTEGTEYDSADIPLLTTYTKRIVGTDHRVNPNTGTPWTIAQVNAVQAGPKVRS